MLQIYAKFFLGLAFTLTKLSLITCWAKAACLRTYYFATRATVHCLLWTVALSALCAPHCLPQIVPQLSSEPVSLSCVPLMAQISSTIEASLNVQNAPSCRSWATPRHGGAGPSAKPQKTQHLYLYLPLTWAAN